MKKKISTVLLASVIATNISPAINVFAEEVVKENAVQIEQKVFSEAKITNFNLNNYNNYEGYNNEYKISRDEIIEISNNGGRYFSSVIENAIDGNTSTHWETGKPNDSDFKNEVVFEFDDVKTINRIAYATRQDGAKGKGFPNEFEIYSSVSGKDEDYTLVSTGAYGTTGNMMEFKFDTIDTKKLKFVFKEANQGWASASEFMFYTKDEVLDEVLDLFTDKTLENLKPEYKSIEVINTLQEKLNNHPLKEDLQKYIDIAKDILNNNIKTVKTVIAEQHGNMNQHAQNNLKFGFGNNLQPTGVLAKPGDKLEVYVDVEEGKPLPKLFFSQQEGSWSNWGATINLIPGKNIITVPKISQEDNYKHAVTPGGPVYIVNPYTSEEQGRAPKIRFASGVEVFPYFDENTNEEEFLNFLKEYKKKIDEDIINNPNVMDRKVIDTFEFKSDRIFFTGTASGAYEAYVEKGIKPIDTVNSWNRHMDTLFKYYGLDGNNLNDDPKFIRDNIRLAQPWGYMYAASNHVGVQRDVMTQLLIPFEDRNSSNWGIDHEIGHRMDMKKRLYGESTNNMLPIFMDFNSGVKPGNSIPYDKVYKNVMSENSNVFVEGNYFERIAPFWQLELYKPGYWAEFNSLYRERDKDIIIEGGDKQEESKTKYIVEFSSEILNMDLSEYFKRHGFPVTDEVKKEMASKYKKPDKKLWYINDSLWGYKGNGFIEGTTPNLSLSKSNDKIKLDFNVSKENQDDLLGYEILKNGGVIGFTSKDSFIDEQTNLENNDVYAVIAYDRNLNKSNTVNLNSHSPIINLTQEKVTLKLKEDFNPMDFVKAVTYDGKNITSTIEVDSNVDINKKGNYTVKYTAKSNNITKEVLMNVEVVSDYDYLSDKEWTSVKTGWGTPSRNQNLKGRLNGEIKNFEKGFKIHANGEIVYELGDHKYENFEALVGVDMTVVEQDRSSITFKVTGDGKNLANTSVLKYKDNMVYLNVPIKDVNELKIEVYDGGNGNSYDHGVVINPKLTEDNIPPTVEVPKNPDIDPDTEKDNIKLSDVNGHWAEDYIKDFVNKGHIKGYGDNTFKPNNNITRAEFIRIVNMAFGFTQKGSENFSDVNQGDWYYDEVLKAVKQGYIQGYVDKTFRPNDKITREEACKIIGTILKVSGDGKTKFKDEKEISDWSIKYVDGLVDMGIINGYEDDTFKAKNNATRAESVKILYVAKSKGI
ncbi:S-layer homology domain-containing protein [Paraclostridium bifermentans]|uniref:S-layer homology domain-containing protein n=1 Tax=Paraclostridium bifermentans TaxID=1490 RepID=UPI00359C8B98